MLKNITNHGGVRRESGKQCSGQKARERYLDKDSDGNYPQCVK